MRRSRARLSIGQLAELTGADPATLRSWEARYGIPEPARTSGGQRRYAPAEVDRVRAMKRLIDAGYRTSEAARAAGRPGAEPPAHPGPKQGGDDLLLALLAGDLGALRLLDARLESLTVEELISEVMSPLLNRIGEMWARGEATVAQEHAASALIAAWLGAQTRNAPAPLRPELILTAAPQGERHEIGLLMLSTYLRRQGAQVLYLGADLPVDDAVDAVAARSPSVVCFGLVTEAGRAAFAETAKRIATMAAPPVLACGGAWKPPDHLAPGVIRLPDDLEAATARVLALAAG